MWSIIFSRSDSGNVSMAITFRLLLISPAPEIILIGRRCISDNLDAFGNPRDANLLQSQNFCANPPPSSKAPYPVRIARWLEKRAFYMELGGNARYFFAGP